MWVTYLDCITAQVHLPRAASSFFSYTLIFQIAYFQWNSCLMICISQFNLTAYRWFPGLRKWKYDSVASFVLSGALEYLKNHFKIERHFSLNLTIEVTRWKNPLCHLLHIILNNNNKNKKNNPPPHIEQLVFGLSLPLMQCQLLLLGHKEAKTTWYLFLEHSLADQYHFNEMSRLSNKLQVDTAVDTCDYEVVQSSSTSWGSCVERVSIRNESKSCY